MISMCFREYMFALMLARKILLLDAEKSLEWMGVSSRELAMVNSYVLLEGMQIIRYIQ